MVLPMNSGFQTGAMSLGRPMAGTADSSPRDRLEEEGSSHERKRLHPNDRRERSGGARRQPVGNRAETVRSHSRGQPRPLQRDQVRLATREAAGVHPLVRARASRALTRFRWPSRTVRSTRTARCSTRTIEPSSKSSIRASSRFRSSPTRPATVAEDTGQIASRQAGSTVADWGGNDNSPKVLPGPRTFAGAWRDHGPPRRAFVGSADR
jgi:hypothetical protein